MESTKRLLSLVVAPDLVTDHRKRDIILEAKRAIVSVMQDMN